MDLFRKVREFERMFDGTVRPRMVSASTSSKFDDLKGYIDALYTETDRTERAVEVFLLEAQNAQALA